jgi:hypothetical protein
MSFKGLTEFQEFAYTRFFEGKRFTFVRADTWSERGSDGSDEALGSKVIAQIIEDKTAYNREGVDNFGALLTVKVRGHAPSAFQKFKPLQTEVIITDVERAVIWGEYRNELAIIAVMKAKGSE